MPAAGGEKKADAEKKEPFSIDFDGIENRILALPIPAGDLFALQAGDAGHFFYQRREGRDASLNHYDLAKRKNETPLASADGYLLSADAKKVLYVKDRAWFITAMGPKITPGEGRIAAADIEVAHRPARRVDADFQRGVARSTAIISTRPTCTASTGRR